MPDQEQQQKSAAAQSFIHSVLGRYSSHPEMLKTQRNALFLLGLLPVVATIVLIIYAYTHGIASIGKWSNLVLSFKILLIGTGITVGFILTAVAMNLASRTMANSKFGQASDKDAGVPPLGILAIIAFFWLVPWAYSHLPYWSRSKDVELILNLICLAEAPPTTPWRSTTPL